MKKSKILFSLQGVFKSKTRVREKGTKYYQGYCTEEANNATVPLNECPLSFINKDMNSFESDLVEIDLEDGTPFEVCLYISNLGQKVRYFCEEVDELSQKRVDDMNNPVECHDFKGYYSGFSY